MKAWEDLLTRPDSFADGPAADAWLAAIATRLLTGARLLVGGEPHRFTEVEAYYHGPGHLDPFTHRDPVQLERGRWYFHRTRGEYRGGSFKGLDLAFGDGSAFAGFLIRGIEAADGTLIDGPSLTVDRLLDRTGASSVAQLDGKIGGRPAWEASLPLVLEWSDGPPRAAERSARVGLSLKRHRPGSPAASFLLRP
jgi:hypothetical protein